MEAKAINMKLLSAENNNNNNNNVSFYISLLSLSLAIKIMFGEMGHIIC